MTPSPAPVPQPTRMDAEQRLRELEGEIVRRRDEIHSLANELFALELEARELKWRVEHWHDEDDKGGQ